MSYKLARKFIVVQISRFVKTNYDKKKAWLVFYHCIIWVLTFKNCVRHVVHITRGAQFDDKAYNKHPEFILR